MSFSNVPQTIEPFKMGLSSPGMYHYQNVSSSTLLTIGLDGIGKKLTLQYFLLLRHILYIKNV